LNFFTLPEVSSLIIALVSTQPLTQINADNRLLRRILGSKTDEVTKVGENCIVRIFKTLLFSKYN
jgi:hypothetical protein